MLQGKLKEIREQQEVALKSYFNRIQSLGWGELADSLLGCTEEVFYAQAIIETIEHIEGHLSSCTFSESYGEDEKVSTARTLLTKLLVQKYNIASQSSPVRNVWWDSRRQAIAYVYRQISAL